MYANPCLITAGIVPAIYYYNVLPYVGSYISQVQLLPVVFLRLHPVSPQVVSRYFTVTGLARLAYLGAHLSWRAPMLLCITCELVPRYLVYDDCTVDVAMP